jgi:hypothetical protein
VATGYDEVRSDVKESQDRSLEALKSASAPDARSVVTELDESDALDEGLTPGGEIVSEELIVQVIPQGRTNSPARRVSWSGIGPNSHSKATASRTVSSAKADGPTHGDGRLGTALRIRSRPVRASNLFGCPAALCACRDIRLQLSTLTW